MLLCRYAAVLMVMFVTVSTQPDAASAILNEAPIDVSQLTGKIVYSYEGDIYVMNTDGTAPTQLTTHPDADFDPAWSPDGSKIAFRSHRDGNEEVYVMNADGSDQQNLSNSPGGDYSPVWSPDGKQIAFMSDRTDRGSGNSVWILNADGSEPFQVTDIPGINEYPTWSPDGKRLAFHCTFGKVITGGEGDFEICVVNVDGTGLKQLTDTDGTNKVPAWSPDGEYIAFESTRDGWPTLPDYVPLGYERGDFGDDEIYIMRADGTEQINITNHPREGDSFPAWSRDGLLVFSRYGCLMVMRADGTGVAQITKSMRCAGSDSGHFPDWYQPASVTD